MIGTPYRISRRADPATRRTRTGAVLFAWTFDTTTHVFVPYEHARDKHPRPRGELQAYSPCREGLDSRSIARGNGTQEEAWGDRGSESLEADRWEPGGRVARIEVTSNRKFSTHGRVTLSYRLCRKSGLVDQKSSDRSSDCR